MSRRPPDMCEQNAVTVECADYRDPDHAASIVYLLDQYARDPMGGGAALPDAVKENLVPALLACPNAFSFLAYIDARPAGLLNGFIALSTFRAQPLFNVHDVVVLPEFRRRGVAQQLFLAAERFARERGCCKLTLEVLEGNSGARALYGELGFSGYSLTPATGCALFLQKML